MLTYSSTRSNEPVSSARAVVNGLASDGGLYTMAASDIPGVELSGLVSLDYYELASKIVSRLLPDFSEAEALELVRRAYTGKFSSPELTPTVSVADKHVLELFHGPTSAFKDMALCLLPHLMKHSAEKCGNKDDIMILTATSGDTGKAAMEGFRDVDGIRIIVFYPRDGVSAVQKAQMATQEGRNVTVCSVEGNFDDAQSGVKNIFENVRGRGLSSANSINIGRLVPQVVYYFYSYFSLVRNGSITLGDEVSFCVPTGNFGDILAGYIAKQMGLPCGKFICASNENNVLTDFINTGVYDRRRPFHKTASPSMDILISSNLERLLYLMSGDRSLVASLMQQLKSDGHYTVPAELLEKIQSDFCACCCDDAAALETIGKIWKDERYLCDTHTAVAWNAAEQYQAQSGDKTPIVVLSTASAYKFPAAVLKGIGLECAGDEFDMMTCLEDASKVPMPENLRGLREREVLHFDCVRPEDMQSYVIGKLEEKA